MKVSNQVVRLGTASQQEYWEAEESAPFLVEAVLFVKEAFSRWGSAVEGAQP